MKLAIRAVFDTNIVISALVFKSAATARLREHWRLGMTVPIVCPATASELLRVLGYPKFALDEDRVGSLLSDYLPYAETARDPGSRIRIPECRDPDDEVFLRLAYATRADALVSGDADLLVLADHARIPILTLAQYRERFG
jgi:putative PIN family toxin of toxin-antitoxin system